MPDYAVLGDLDGEDGGGDELHGVKHDRRAAGSRKEPDKSRGGEGACFFAPHFFVVRVEGLLFWFYFKVFLLFYYYYYSRENFRYVGSRNWSVSRKPLWDGRLKCP